MEKGPLAHADLCSPRNWVYSCLHKYILFEFFSKILTRTFDAISRPAISTCTFEASWCICTYSKRMAIMCTNLTFIDICNTKKNSKKMETKVKVMSEKYISLPLNYGLGF